MMMMKKRINRLLSNTTVWLGMTGLVVVILIFDGIVTNLPFYDLQNRQALTVQLFFVVEVLICALCQIIYLKIIRRKYDTNPVVGHLRRYSDLTYYIVSITQYLIIALRQQRFRVRNFKSISYHNSFNSDTPEPMSFCGHFSASCISIFNLDKIQKRSSHNCIYRCSLSL